jgi:hypothetical protein
MTTTFLVRLLILLCAVCSPAFAAETPRQLAWEDLTFKLPAAENPFANMSMEQLEALADVAGVRNRKARGVKLTASEIAMEREATEKLKKMGLDADALLTKRAEVAEKQQALAGAVNTSLDGKLVRVPGYMLPLEFSGKQVTEFLLVPWVGACIHTPPPQPNQIVHVKADKPIAVNGMFDAVWVTGRIAATAARKSVYITDGTTEIDVGYSIRASQVEPYR